MNNKIKYGDVSTPKYFVEKILDLLPNNVWYNPDLKWLDPGCGNGIFISCIYEHLFVSLKDKIIDDKKRRDHIIENMLYMVEINDEYIQSLYTIFGEKANIYNEDFILWNNDSQFDIIVGNPPYNVDGIIKVPTKNSINKKNDGKAIWKLFIKKSLSIMNHFGYLCVCIPTIWMKPDKENMYDLFFKNNIVKIQCYDNSETNKIFSYSAQTPICCICLQNNKHKQNNQCILLYDKYVKNDFISYTLDYSMPIPLEYAHIFTILQPYVKKYGSLFDYIIKTNMPPNNTFLSRTLNEECKYFNIHSCLIKNKVDPQLYIQYSNHPLIYSGVRKIVCAHKMYGFPYYDCHGKYGISNRDNYVILENEKINMKQLFMFLSTSFCRTLFKATRYRMKYLEKYIFQLIPNICNIPDFPLDVNNDSIFSFFSFDFDTSIFHEKINYRSFNFIEN